MKKRADGRYLAQVVVVDGGIKKRHDFYGRSQAEVKQKMTEFTGERLKSPPFEVFAENWKEKHFADLANGSKMCYNPAVKRAKKAFADKRVSEVTAADVSRLLLGLKSQGLGSKTVKTQKTVLNMIFNAAIVDGYITSNPTTAVPLPANLPKHPREIATDDAIKIVSESTALPFGLFPALVLYTGCRRAEALALQFKDVHRAEGYIDIAKAVYFKNNKAFLKVPKTEAGTRRIILLDQLAEILPSGPESDYIFGGKELLTERQYQNRWKAYARAAGLVAMVDGNPKAVKFLVTPHQLRHAYATMLFEAGIDEFSAKTLLGHTDIKLTRNIYTHLRQRQQGANATKLREYFSQNPVEQANPTGITQL